MENLIQRLTYYNTKINAGASNRQMYEERDRILIEIQKLKN